jgi:glutamate synthase (NADPH/NADH) small chain
MGKATGFMDYQRLERPAQAPGERVSHFGEFHEELTPEQRQEQGGRCMNCGVPFCQSDYGCPLHNLIPEWNDDVYSGNYAHALARLLKTNNFPEFTGRVCPALCQTACTCGLNGQPVSVRDNELALIEYGFENGLMAPRIPSVRTGKRVAIIGSGPSGLAAADQLNQRGHNVTIYEREDKAGGLLMYGIPNMKLEKSVVDRRVARMEAEGVTFVTSVAVGKDMSGTVLLETYDAVILCCGAGNARDIQVENRDAQGVYQALDYLTESTKSLLAGRDSGISAKELDVVIIGNGDTATDCLATAIRQGARSVTQLVRKPAAQANEENTWPQKAAGEKVDYGHEEALAVYGTDPRLYESSAKALVTDEAGKLTAVVAQKAGQELTLPAQLLLIAAGFSGAEATAADALGLGLNDRGLVETVAPYQTANDKVFVAGDMRRGASLVATAIAEGRACAKAVDKYLDGYTNM